MRFALIPALTFAVLSATAVHGQTAMTAAEFETYATDKTLTYSVGGEVYGVEHYLPGRRVVWAFKDDDCARGIWYEKAGLICFAYENLDPEQCWTFFPSATGLRAQFAGDQAASPQSEVAESTKPLICAGPDVGV
jgi:hypothetical protein